MPRAALKNFIYNNLPYLLLAALALALILTDKEMGFGLASKISYRESEGIRIGLVEQRMVGFIALGYAVFRILRRTNR